MQRSAVGSTARDATRSHCVADLRSAFAYLVLTQGDAAPPHTWHNAWKHTDASGAKGREAAECLHCTGFSHNKELFRPECWQSQG